MIHDELCTKSLTFIQIFGMKIYETFSLNPASIQFIFVLPFVAIAFYKRSYCDEHIPTTLLIPHDVRVDIIIIYIIRMGQPIEKLSEKNTFCLLAKCECGVRY